MTDYVYVDTETTGLTDNDELLSVSVVNDQGECLYHSLLKPEHTESWEAAETVNAITPEMVADAPSYNAVKEQLGNIFEGKHVVAYNMAFDGRFLEEPLKKAASTHCAMLAYAEYNGEWDEERNCFKWKKLADAVQNLASDFKFKAHDSLEDTKALKVVWDGLKNNKAIMNKYGAINEVEANKMIKVRTRDELQDLVMQRIRERGSNCDLNDIDVSSITDMSNMFGYSDFTGDISKWNVSNVRDMTGMFYGSRFNGDISKWDVSNVKYMSGMFNKSKFNGDISKWDVSNVKYMADMFANSKFTGDISNWDTSNVKNMSGMFAYSDFNGNISRWDVSNVENMSYMFIDSKFTGDISKWDTSKVDSVKPDTTLEPEQPKTEEATVEPQEEQKVEAVVDSKQSNAENKYLDFMVDTFVTAIGNGTAPWEKDWTTGDMANLRPFNPETGSIYSGRNAILLSAVSMNAGYKDNRWVTFNQAKKAGGQVKKGQHGVPCSVWITHDEKPVLDDNGQPVLNEKGEPKMEKVPKERPIHRQFTLFNVKQIAWPEGHQYTKEVDLGTIKSQSWENLERADAVMKNINADIRYGGNRAYFSPFGDYIQLPEKEKFKSQEGFYSTAFHELTHWSGHESRLNRDMGIQGTVKYAKEELVAEISSYMMCLNLGIGHNVENHASYVNSWFQDLKETGTKQELQMAITDAVRKANEASKYLFSYSKEHDIREDRQYLDVKEEDYKKLQDLGAFYDQEMGKWYIDNSLDATKFEEYIHHKVVSEHDVYIDVDYKDKNEAKSLGAKWDRSKKSWYIPAGEDLSLFAKWQTMDTPKNVINPKDQTESKVDSVKPDTTLEPEQPKTEEATVEPQEEQKVEAVESEKTSEKLDQLNLPESIVQSVDIACEPVGPTGLGYYSLKFTVNGVDFTIEGKGDDIRQGVLTNGVDDFTPYDEIIRAAGVDYDTLNERFENGDDNAGEILGELQGEISEALSNATKDYFEEQERAEREQSIQDNADELAEMLTLPKYIGLYYKGGERAYRQSEGFKSWCYETAKNGAGYYDAQDLLDEYLLDEYFSSQPGIDELNKYKLAHEEEEETRRRTMDETETKASVKFSDDENDKDLGSVSVEKENQNTSSNEAQDAVDDVNVRYYPGKNFNISKLPNELKPYVKFDRERKEYFCIAKSKNMAPIEAFIKTLDKPEERRLMVEQELRKVGVNVTLNRSIMEKAFNGIGKLFDKKEEVKTPKQEQAKGMNEKIYLNVPYKQIDEAKAQGAKWDKQANKWYATDKNIDKLSQWLQPQEDLENTDDAIDAMIKDMRSNGMIINRNELKFDGSGTATGRCRCEGDRQGEKAGWYTIHLDGCPTLSMQNHRTGGVLKKSYPTRESRARFGQRNPGKVYSAQVADEVRKQEATKKAEDDAKLAYTSKKIRTELEHYHHNKAEYPESSYLQSKGLTKKMDEATYMLKTKNDCYTCFAFSNINGQITTKQYISSQVDPETGKFAKRWETGGQKAGSFHVVNGFQKLAKSNTPLIIAEGIATALSVQFAIGQEATVVSAGDCGNLMSVAKALREKFPDRAIVMAADNDHLRQDNPGLFHANEAAKAVGGTVISPQFGPGDKGTDFNDVMLTKGLPAVKSIICTHLEQNCKHKKSHSR